MLILTRRVGEAVMIGNEVTVTILGVKGNQVRVGVNAPRDVAAYAILKELEAGRGTPHGGAYLDFRHIPEAQLRAAFGPVIDRLLTNGIDLTKTPVEVGPTAHYHMGGVRVDRNMRTRIDGLYAAGEAVGGANGANRLSGNAITEAVQKVAGVQRTTTCLAVRLA